MQKASPRGSRKPHENLNPHKPARMAMYLYGSRYAQQGGGSMDFWDKLTPTEQRICRECVEMIAKSPEENS